MTELDIVKDKMDRLETLIQRQSYELEGIRKLLSRNIKDNQGLYKNLAEHKALENIENEIIARACRNGVCED